jgi:hypothetical protein
MALVATGFDAVTAELKRMRAAQAPAITKAIADTAKFGNELAVNEIFNKYGFKSKSYVEQNLGYSINPKTLTGNVFGRYRPSSLTRFATAKYRIGKRSQQVANGHTIRSIRNEPSWFKGTFSVLGRNGNQIMFQRMKGDNWRALKGQKTMYGPSVAGSFSKIRDDIEPTIIAHLRNKYGQYANR